MLPYETLVSNGDVIMIFSLSLVFTRKKNKSSFKVSSLIPGYYISWILFTNMFFTKYLISEVNFHLKYFSFHDLSVKIFFSIPFGMKEYIIFHRINYYLLFI